ncbi:universal stress protein [Streptomyces sp. NPDC059165]|uniref:universal stress protein n=1 Tax=Streptomyces sp. NPDC059165 TaxID=3346751 RepID=UPI003676627C
MTTIRRLPVVVGIDVQDQGVALDWAADEAARRSVPLRLLHAVLPVAHHVRGVSETAHHKALRRLGDEALARSLQRVRERRPGLEVTTTTSDANPAQALVRASARAGLVVLGSRRLGRLAAVLSAASTTVPVSANAACPVVVVPEARRTVGQPPCLVVGVDGSASAAAALAHALDDAASRAATVRAVWVWQPPLLGSVDEPAAIESCRRQLHEATEGRSATHPDVPLGRAVLRGHPVEVLAQDAERAIAVVVGRRGREGFVGMRLGSVPHGLLRRAACPVVVVPPLAPGDREGLPSEAREGEEPPSAVG